MDDAPSVPVTPSSVVRIRPSMLADLEHLAWRNRHRLRAWTELVDGRVVGIGGVQIMEDGPVVAFVDLTEEARRYPLSLHRAAVRFMQELRRSGIRRVMATADPAQPAAERWLDRLGFSPVEVDGTTIYLWQV